MKKQKLLAGLLALTMALALAACGGEEPAEEEPALPSPRRTRSPARSAPTMNP